MTCGFAVRRTPMPYFRRLWGTCLARWIYARLNGDPILASIISISENVDEDKAMLTENSEARRPIAMGPHHSRADRGLGKHGGSPMHGNPGGPRQNCGVGAAIGIAGGGMKALRLHGRGALRRLEFLGWPYWIILLNGPRGRAWAEHLCHRERLPEVNFRDAAFWCGHSSTCFTSP